MPFSFQDALMDSSDIWKRQEFCALLTEDSGTVILRYSDVSCFNMISDKTRAVVHMKNGVSYRLDESITLENLIDPESVFCLIQ